MTQTLPLISLHRVAFQYAEPYQFVINRLTGKGADVKNLKCFTEARLLAKYEYIRLCLLTFGMVKSLCVARRSRLNDSVNIHLKKKKKIQCQTGNAAVFSSSSLNEVLSGSK